MQLEVLNLRTMQKDSHNFCPRDVGEWVGGVFSPDVESCLAGAEKVSPGNIQPQIRGQNAGSI